MWLLFATYITIGLILVLSKKARGAIKEGLADIDTDGQPSWKVYAFLLVVYSLSVLFWPFFLRSWFAKPKTALDAMNEFGITIIPSAYRSIAEKRDEPLPDSLSDQQIFEFYKQAGTALREASIEKNEFLSAGVLNSIIYEILQDVRIYGVDHFKRSLEYQLNSYQKHGVAPAFSNNPIDLLPSLQEKDENDPDEFRSRVEAIIDRCEKLSDLVEQITEPRIKADITKWDLNDPTLLKYLGYVVGIFEAGAECTYGRSSSNHLIIETLFHAWVERNLSDVPQVSHFLELHADTVFRGGNTIGALMDKQDFLVAMVKGGRTLIAFNQAIDQNQVTIAVTNVVSDLLELGLLAHAPEIKESSNQNTDRGRFFSAKSDAIDYAVDLETTGLRTEVSQDKLTGHWKVIVIVD